MLDAPDPRTRLGTRDRAMLHLAYAGGLRVSELVTLQLRDFPDRFLSTVHIMGKGRRERVLPCVVQIVSTGEALQERRLAEIPTDEWDDVSVDITPREYI